MTNRTHLQIALKPADGYRFQPTGFPDLGAATYRRPDDQGGWVEALHVESPQSMANRLEATTWDAAVGDQPEPLRGLPYVRVLDTEGQLLTTSRQEAHRLASAYIMNAKQGGVPMVQSLGEALGGKKVGVVDHAAVAAEVARLDPVSLVHGVFFAQKGWARQPKIARAVTCFIDADDVQPATSGGVKTDPVQVRVDGGESGGAKEGYGMVPHQRVEYTARSITAYVSIDHAQIRSYRLGDAGTELVEALVQYELAHLFRGEDGLRLRTACDLTVKDESTLSGIIEPAAADERVAQAISAASDLLGEVTEVTWAAGK